MNRFIFHKQVLTHGLAALGTFIGSFGLHKIYGGARHINLDLAPQNLPRSRFHYSGCQELDDGFKCPINQQSTATCLIWRTETHRVNEDLCNTSRYRSALRGDYGATFTHDGVFASWWGDSGSSGIHNESLEEEEEEEAADTNELASRNLGWAALDLDSLFKTWPSFHNALTTIKQEKFRKVHSWSEGGYLFALLRIIASSTGLAILAALVTRSTINLFCFVETIPEGISTRLFGPSKCPRPMTMTESSPSLLSTAIQFIQDSTIRRPHGIRNLLALTEIAMAYLVGLYINTTSPLQGVLCAMFVYCLNYLALAIVVLTVMNLYEFARYWCGCDVNTQYLSTEDAHDAFEQRMKLLFAQKQAIAEQSMWDEGAKVHEE
ncbi:hypothetical protein EJ08DRAFT_695911 [Tothia fuscella]|uniref:Uncharacterized protein n=1 Tax=Tothia fuscella TaxID=1048955 RepID=A0A9P4NTW1_9PEZI|nr:hypothetical protein EJ08DRAFT_695911 [Tothia fuscella]